MTIGITYTGNPDKHDNYVRWITQQDAIETVLLKPGVSFEGIDGLVLSGGIDIDPSLYGASSNYAYRPEEWDHARDVYELDAIGYALARNIPVLGVCRGLQLINVYCGGTLIQDLGEQGNDLHKAGASDRLHAVTIDTNSLLGEISGVPDGEVNSAHHQAIDRLGAGLCVNARSAQGLIEGIEPAQTGDMPFLLAVQWHPERMFINNLPDTALYMRLRDRFIQEIHNNTI